MSLGRFERGSRNTANAPSRRTNEPEPYAQLRINHKTAEFEIEKSKISLGRSIHVVMVGLIRNRVMWNKPYSGSGERGFVVCKSYDAITGYPDLQSFPWEDSSFANVDSNHKGVPCASCNFKGAQRGGGTRCTQNWIVPIIVQRTNKGPASVATIPWTIHFTASSIGPLTEYLDPYRESGTSTYVSITEISLSKRERDDTIWTVAEFSEVGKTDPAHHDIYSEHLAAARRIFATPPAHETVTLKPMNSRP